MVRFKLTDKKLNAFSEIVIKTKESQLETRKKHYFFYFFLGSFNSFQPLNLKQNRAT